MNIVFFGSSNFAVPSLQALLTAGHNISGVITQPDRQKDRGLHLAETEIKKVSQGAGLKIYQPQRINLPREIKLLKGLHPDLFVIIAYGQILSQEILNIPAIFSINLHASLLPKYRGAAPINWAIINGEQRTGVTVIKLVKEMDAGPIILQKAVDVDEQDTSVRLEEKLSFLAAELLLDSLKAIANNNFSLTPQDKNQVSFAPRLKKEDGLINWRDSAVDIYNLIRGCLRWPGTFTYYHGKLLKIHRVRVMQAIPLQSKAPAGEIIKVSKEGIIVATGKDNLMIEELQREGKRIMKTEEFIAGHKICVGEMFSDKKDLHF
ncbi:MAG: methionyl-tRNA formyltransferase [Candidatus Omnitrophica bacterium]|nr:methionyl-tRNA formyltransferase [Candidatus Omnitrophota bacterium]